MALLLRRALWSLDFRPRVSVIIPVFNQIDLAIEAAQSVLNQDYPRVELVVVNDGSTEDISPLKALTQRDERAVLLSKPNGGTASARNFALNRVGGEYVAFLDADDLWLPGKLKRQVQDTYLAGAEVSYTSFFVTFPSRGLGPVEMTWGGWPASYPEIVVKSPVSMSTVVFHRSVFADGRRFVVAKRDCDVPFFVKLAKEGRRFLGIKEALSTVRFDDGSSMVNWRAQYETIEIFLEIYRSAVDTMPEIVPLLPDLVKYMEHCRTRHAASGSELNDEAIKTLWGPI
jgi:glycosyltransferase involved in cell wall biosynthesis